MTKVSTQVWVRRLGLATGFAVAVIGLLAWRMPHGNGILGLDLRMTAAQTGELQAAPLTPFLSVTGMGRGDSRERAFTLRNETAVTLAVRLRASAEVRDVDASLRLRLSAGQQILFDGALGELRRHGAKLVLPRGASRRIDVTASIPRSATGGYEGRILDVQLDPLVRRIR